MIGLQVNGAQRFTSLYVNGLSFLYVWMYSLFMTKAKTVSALQKGVELLARREHSQHELTEKLIKKGFDEPKVYAAIERLIERNYLSDQRFTEQFVAMRIRQGKGPLKIINDLRLKGVDSTTINGVLGDYEVEYWRELAKEVYSKKFGDNFATEPKLRAKWQRFLVSRGFEYAHFPVQNEY